MRQQIISATNKVHSKLPNMHEAHVGQSTIVAHANTHLAVKLTERVLTGADRR